MSVFLIHYIFDSALRSIYAGKVHFFFVDFYFERAATVGRSSSWLMVSRGGCATLVALIDKLLVAQQIARLLTAQPWPVGYPEDIRTPIVTISKCVGSLCSELSPPTNGL
jgi:hypothetical protein